MRILICDDEITRQRNLRSILASMGYRAADIQSTDTPRTAINTAKKSRFDILLLASEIKADEGCFEVLSKIRGDRRIGSLPVVLYSSEVSHDLVIEASKAGASGFLRYPFSVSDVESAIKTAVKSSKS